MNFKGIILKTQEGGGVLIVDEKNNLTDLSVLYVEDEAQIREEMESFLEVRVKTLYTAQNGEEGWELFQKFKPDIVISDINMPKMNGIEMSEKIKNEDKNVPIILITAFSDVDYMMRAISAGVDRYILKPVNTAKLDETIRFVAENLINMRTTERRKQTEELIDILNAFLEFSPNPIIIYENSKVKFANNNFLKISKKEKESLLESSFNLEDLFEKREGSISSLAELKLNYKENKVSIKGEYGRHIFYLLQNNVETEAGNIFQMYTFNDITLIEYHKIKINNYNFRLEDFINRINVTRTQHGEKSLLQEPTNFIKEEAEAVVREKRELSKVEENVLKKSRSGRAFSAAEYAQEIDEYVLEDIGELSQIESEIAGHLNMYEMDKDIESLFDIAGALVKYSSVVAQLFEFEDLSFAIKSLADLLAGIDVAKMDETKHRKTEIFLSALMSDILNWRMTIFVDCSANDIHYLDASLFSTILQLELVLNDKQAVAAQSEEDDDFELF